MPEKQWQVENRTAADGGLHDPNLRRQAMRRLNPVAA